MKISIVSYNCNYKPGINRYYNPALSQWLSIGLLAEKYPGISPYTYTADNPVMLTDREGKDPMFGKNFWGKLKYIGNDGKNNGNIHLVKRKLKRMVKRMTKKGKCFSGKLNNAL